MSFPVDCMDFVEYKKQIEGDDGLAKELQDGNQSRQSSRKSKLTRLLALADMYIIFILLITGNFT